LWAALWLDFDLRVPAPPELLAALRAIESVRDLSADADKLAVQVSDEAYIPTIISAVAANGGQIMRVNPREHSLEDIYFELQRRSETS
jgi:hypothetical protein